MLRLILSVVDCHQSVQKVELIEVLVHCDSEHLKCWSAVKILIDLIMWTSLPWETESVSEGWIYKHSQDLNGRQMDWCNIILADIVNVTDE